MKINKIIHGDALEELKKFDNDCIDMCITSPPYWGLRDYGESVNTIWDGDENCDHEWGKEIIKKGQYGLNVGFNERWGGSAGQRKQENMKPKELKQGNFCSKCHAWRGQLGLEPTFELYIKHLCDIFDEVKRVLKPMGTCFVNLGDTYGGSGCGTNDYRTEASRSIQGIGKNKELYKTGGLAQKIDYPSKCLCCIPDRFKIEMINRGWILRNTIIWYKLNCMPSSAKDRFTVDFEYLFFFVKSNKVQYWTNSKTGKVVTKHPLGTKGAKGIDWEWREIGEDYSNCDTKISVEESEKLGSPRARVHREKKHKKVSLWTSHDYWFEQQFEKHKWEHVGKARIGEKSKNSGSIKNPVYGMGNTTGSFRAFGEEGRNCRAVWKIPTQPYPEAHFAVYPEALIETPIKAGCPQYICKKCGVAREKILKPTERYAKILGKGFHDHKDDSGKGMLASAKCYGSDDKIHELKRAGMSCAEYKCVGYTDCGCNAGFRAGIVLDPFIGSGTTAVVARKLARDFIGIELNESYISMANKRLMAIPESLFKNQ